MSAAKRRGLAALGPAILVSVGYMDPGNWATDIEGGARFGYQLLWVLVVSNALALLLQGLSAKLAIVSGLDLASACRKYYGPLPAAALWLLAECAIVACDLAELIGSALALNLLFGVPLLAGALLTSLAVLVILSLPQRGLRRLEAIVLGMLLVVAGCMLVDVCLAAPAPRALAAGLVPRLHGHSLYVAIAILGATVMPHNLYLHSALAPRASEPAQAPALIRESRWTTALALNLALLVNAAILILAAAVFSTRGMGVTDLRAAHGLLAPLLGTQIAPVLFAVALLCSGQSASLSGTLAGQIVMQGFVQIRMRPMFRQLLTRCLALVPALIVLGYVGERGLTPMMVASQVVLSLQLPFAVVPLIKLTSAPEVMGAHASSARAKFAAIASAALIVVLNGTLIVRTIVELRESSPIGAGLLSIVTCAGFALLCLVTGLRLAPREACSCTATVDPASRPRTA